MFLILRLYLDAVDWMSAIQELKEKQGIDIKQEMERYVFVYYHLINSFTKMIIECSKILK